MKYKTFGQWLDGKLETTSPGLDKAAQEFTKEIIRTTQQNIMYDKQNPQKQGEKQPGNTETSSPNTGGTGTGTQPGLTADQMKPEAQKNVDKAQADQNALAIKNRETQSMAEKNKIADAKSSAALNRVSGITKKV